MQQFWQLLSILICLAGFVITGGVLLFRGESFLVAVIRALAVFFGLYVVQIALGGILTALTRMGPSVPGSAEEPPAQTRVTGE